MLSNKYSLILTGGLAPQRVRYELRLELRRKSMLGRQLGVHVVHCRLVAVRSVKPRQSTVRYELQQLESRCSKCKQGVSALLKADRLAKCNTALTGQCKQGLATC